jgi:hypothetical protein
MKWSKLKKLAEALLADSLSGRIQYHITQYGRGDSYIMARAWITLDGQEIANFSSVEWLMQSSAVAGQIRAENHCQDYSDTNQQAGYYAAYGQANTELARQSVFSKNQFYWGLIEYVQMSIDSALTSTDPIIQAIAMFDRRFGIRRLETFELPADAPELISQCLQIRCQAEGIDRIHSGNIQY